MKIINIKYLETVLNYNNCLITYEKYLKSIIYLMIINVQKVCQFYYDNFKLKKQRHSFNHMEFYAIPNIANKGFSSSTP